MFRSIIIMMMIFSFIFLVSCSPKDTNSKETMSSGTSQGANVSQEEQNIYYPQSEEGGELVSGENNRYSPSNEDGNNNSFSLEVTLPEETYKSDEDAVQGDSNVLDYENDDIWGTEIPTTN